MEWNQWRAFGSQDPGHCVASFLKTIGTMCSHPLSFPTHRTSILPNVDRHNVVALRGHTMFAHSSNFHLSLSSFVFFSTYKTYPPFTCNQLLPWHLVSKKWTTTWTNNFREFLRELKSFVKPICQFILIKKGYKISGSVLIFITLFFDIICYKKIF